MKGTTICLQYFSHKRAGIANESTTNFCLLNLSPRCKPRISNRVPDVPDAVWILFPSARRCQFICRPGGFRAQRIDRERFGDADIRAERFLTVGGSGEAGSSRHRERLPCSLTMSSSKRRAVMVFEANSACPYSSLIYGRAKKTSQRNHYGRKSIHLPQL